MNTRPHEPVLLAESLRFLDLSKGETVIDATLGTAGHTEHILESIGNSGHLVGIDADQRNLEIAQQRLVGKSNITLIHGNFRNLKELFESNITHTPLADAILFDLGLHSLHVDDPLRGFSFQHDAPLDMRFDPETQTKTAAMILNQSSYEFLVKIFHEFGEERHASSVAKAITAFRKNRPFRRTLELADLVAHTIPAGRLKKKRHPATRIFQALRIAVNSEFEALENGLAAAVDLLKEGGRLVVISYHSLEDRIVKNLFREQARRLTPRLKILTKKPVRPAEDEIARNPRSRSARLRAAERI